MSGAVAHGAAFVRGFGLGFALVSGYVLTLLGVAVLLAGGVRA